MKRRYIITLLASLVFGIAATLLFTAQMSPQSAGDCADLSVPLPSSVRRIDCTGHTYGYPMRFVTAHPDLQVRTADQTNSTPVLLDVTATATVTWTRFAGNIVFWSLACFTLAVIAQAKFGKNQTPQPEAPKSKQKK